MFKKSSKSSQLNIFTSPKSLFSGNSLKMYEDEQARHNQFCKQVTMRIDENIFRPLYCQDSSNIAWLSRYELIHETLRLFYDQVKQAGQLDKAIKDRLDELLKLEDNKVVYICSSEEVKSRLQELGELIYKILPLFSFSTGVHYQTLQRVFNEQNRLDEKKVVVAREKEEISAKSVQSPHDTDCHYRNKDDQKVKGYSINVTESCDDDKSLNLIGHVDVRKASCSDVDFLQHDIEKAQEVFPDKIEAAHADGAYHSPDNQQYCKGNEIDLYLHAIQGAKSRYRGEIKHQMRANIPCLWVNFVRILKYIKQLCQRTSFFAKYELKYHCAKLIFAFQSFLKAILPHHLSSSENTRFSIS